jgi:hypothetical protein
MTNHPMTSRHLDGFDVSKVIMKNGGTGIPVPPFFCFSENERFLSL